MAKGTKDAEARNAHTPRTDEALEIIQNQLDNGHGRVETGTDVSLERERADKEKLQAAGVL
jgi:hypothetical protein